MQKNNDRQEKALELTSRILAEAEEKRAVARFNNGLSELENSKFSILENNEFVDKIGPYLYESFINNDSERVELFFEKLFSQLSVPNRKYNLIILSILDELGVNSLNHSNIRLLQVLGKQYCEVLNKDNQELLLSEKVCRFLSSSALTFVRSSLWQNFENIVDTLWDIRESSLDTTSGKVEPVYDILASIATKDTIEKIVQYHTSGDEFIKKRAKKSISCLGKEAASFLLNRLVFSKTKAERFLIMELIGAIGNSAVDAIQTYLEKDLEWYVIRNLIYIISEIGDTKNYAIVEQYLSHPDLRVQQQVVACIVNLKDNVDKRLVHALPIVHDEIKIKIVMQISGFDGEDLANTMIDLLHKHENFQANIHDELLFKICISLRSYPFVNVISALKNLLKIRETKYGNKDKICISIKETIGILEPKLRHLAKSDNSGGDMLLHDYETSGEQNEGFAIEEFLDEIHTILQSGGREKASTIVYKKIIHSAKAKDFYTAELLRDKLLDINPEALQEVIRAAEIIEEEKNTPETGHNFETSDHIEIWEELYETMTTKEFDAFYYVLRQEMYMVNEAIVSNGEIDPCLFFINSGVVRLTCECGQDETFLKRLKPGDIIGVRQFFSASVWTINLTAQINSQLHILDKNNFLQIKEKFPGIEEKLYDFCKTKEDIPKLVRMSGRDRREYPRHPINITVNYILLDQYMELKNKRILQGETINIARGGLTFTIRILKKENGDLLLGRQILTEINLKGEQVLKNFGVVVGVNYQHGIMKEYSIHVKFQSEISQNQITNILHLVQ